MCDAIKFDARLPITGYDILVYPGQSNTVGNGLGDLGSYAGDAAQDGRIFQIGRFADDAMRMLPASPYLQFWNREDPTPSVSGYGIPLSRLYAATLADPARRLLLIPAAKGGTSILNWLDIITTFPLYADMAARINFALSLPGDNRIIGWFENQGENDVRIIADPGNFHHSTIPDAAAYTTLKLELIDRFRSDFGDVPMLFGGMSEEWVEFDSTRVAVESAISAAAGARSSCMFVPTTGFPSNFALSGDPVHLSAEGVGMLAAAYMAAFSTL